jgi:type III pantothenate kinase
MNGRSPEPLITVDIGNSSIHFGLFTGGGNADLPLPAMRFYLSAASGDFAPLMAWLPPQSPPWFVASVNREWGSRLFEYVAKHRPDVTYRMLDYTRLPLTLGIEHPETAGMDRLAAAVAVNRLRDRDRPAIVVDFGTAITVDAVAADGTFLGGAILPGMELSATALVAGTSQLPPVDAAFSSPPRAIGRSTEPAIRAGLFWAAVGAVRELIRRASGELGAKPLIVATGGGGDALLPHLDDNGEIVYVPHLVLSGIALCAWDLAEE